jgi:gliding motility-associated-like protein
MKKLFLWLLIPFLLMISSNNLSACHGSPLQNYVVTVNPTNITINANSDPATCGCGPYYIEVQLSCTPVFTGASPVCTSPTWNTYPWYHALLNVAGHVAPLWTENCILEPYNPVVIPFSGLCPGQQYWVRSREMVCGSLSAGAWSPVNTFIVPGASSPVLTINASTLIVCPPSCANLTGVITGGCPTTWAYSWSGGLGSAAAAVACPAVATTYTLTATPVCGLPLTQTVTINITPPAVAGVASISSSTICFGQTVSLSLVGSVGTIQWQSAPTAGGPWTNIPAATAATYTSGALTANTCFRANVTGCTNVTSNVVCVTVPPILTATNLKTNVTCFGGNNGSATVTPSGGVGPYTYSWNTAPVQTAATATALTAGSYTCTVTDNIGCVTTTTVLITQPTQVTSTIGMTSSNCGLPNGSATVTPSGGVGPYTYLWSNGQTTQTAINLLSGPYTVTITSVGGCTTTNNIIVNNNGSPTANITGQTNVLCFGNSTGAMTVTPVGGIPPYSYLWSNGQTTQTAINLPAGLYTVTVTASNGCTALASGTITQPTQLNAAITTVNVLCFGNNTGSATATPSGGTGPYTYLWSNAQTTQTATSLLAGTYNCTVTDNNGCNVVVSANITQPTQLSLAITSSISPLCFAGTTGSITVTPAGGVGPAYLYSLNIGPNQLSPSYTGLGAGTYTIKVTDQNGCTATNSVTLTQPTQLTATSSATNVSCFGACNGKLQLNVAGGIPAYSYLWSNGSTTNPVTGLCAGTYSVIVTDVNNCQISLTGLSISQPNLLTVSPIAIPNSICTGQTSSLNSNLLGGTAPYTYTWSTGAITQNTSISPTVTGNYTITVTDINNCSATGTVSVTVAPPINGSASTIPSTICAGQTSTISATATGGNGGPYTYIWSPGGTGQSLVVSPSITTTYTVTISDACSPVVSYTTSVIVNPLPVVTYTTTNLQGCEPLTVTYNNTTPGSGSCVWKINGINYNSCNTTQTFPVQGTYPAILTVTSIDGCTASSGTINAVVHPLPIAQFSTSPSIVNILDPVISFNNSSSIGTYQWSFGDGNTSTMIHPSHTYGDVGSYNVKLIVKTQFGCTDTAYGTIFIYDIFSVYIPNSFTPNGDGINDTWQPIISGAEYYQFLIFDRWGEMLFDSSNLGAPWPGTFKDKDVQEGVYVWKLIIKEKSTAKVHNLVGHVTVIR